MFGKFKPPLLKKAQNPLNERDLRDESSWPTPKRRRISENETSAEDQLNVYNSNASGRKFLSHTRKPLLVLSNPTAHNSAPPPVSFFGSYYNVLWRKYTTKKHKTWDGDGVLYVMAGYAHLRDISGKEMGKTTCNGPLLPGCTLTVGNKEVEVDSTLSREEYLAGRPFLRHDDMSPNPRTQTHPEEKLFHTKQTAVQQPLQEKRARAQITKGSRTFETQGSFKRPLPHNIVLPKNEMKSPIPRHDPSVEGALVMKRPTYIPKGKQVVDVVIDPLLSRSLRSHQREGVKFLYECVMGLREPDLNGALLADDMGLGKTLQTITLLWTLLKQNPFQGEPPVVKKALIVCPVTLIVNWREEFQKWLGLDRLGVFICGDSRQRLTDFTKGRAYNIMIIGYEKLRTISDELSQSKCIDIVVADEGHRLKTAKNKSAQAIRSLDVSKRVILSGTPIQNDLSEFFIMVDFVNPNVLGSFKTFAKKYETPIVRSRQPGALAKDIERGEARSEALASLTNIFILRRTIDILAGYLPMKTEYVLMCRPTRAQKLVYQHVLSSPVFQSALGNAEACLQLITILKKVCNSPWLLSNWSAKDLITVPPRLVCDNHGATKLRALDRLLYILRTTTTEKVVLVSNYTSTLQILESLLTSLGYPYLRLDGSTPSKKRQNLVDEFNRSSASSCFAFLLSAKAGGVGINLVGASRLVLFDVDWNPATDLQAMARIHRDGQKRPCVIYRLLLAGGIDEKIWQRQVTKLGLASNIMDQKRGASSFSREELRDLFRLDEGPLCQTHELLGCRCGGRGLPETPEEKAAPNGDHLSDSPGERGAMSEDDLPDMPQLIQANRVNMEEQERDIQTSKAAFRLRGNSPKIESLMSYMHIDTSKFSTKSDDDMEALVSDEVLLGALKDEENKISFVFAKSST